MRFQRSRDLGGMDEDYSWLSGDNHKLSAPKIIAPPKISKCQSAFGLSFLRNSCRCLLFSLQCWRLWPRFYVRVLPWRSRSSLCATKSACFRGPPQNAQNRPLGTVCSGSVSPAGYPTLPEGPNLSGHPDSYGDSSGYNENRVTL